MATFFGYPLNVKDRNRYKDDTDIILTEVSDNKYTTSTADVELDSGSVDGVTIYLDSNGDGSANDSQRFTHLFIKSKNVTDYDISTATVSGDPPTATETLIEADIKPETEMLTIVGRFQHSLYSFSTPQSDVSRLIIDFTGSNIEIYQIMVLEEKLLLDSNFFSQINPQNDDRVSGIHESLDGVKTRWRSLADRPKRKFQYNKPIIPGIPELEGKAPLYLLREIENFAWENPNFVFAYDFDSDPGNLYTGEQQEGTSGFRGVRATDPSSLNNGDFWYNTADSEWNYRANGSTTSVDNDQSGDTDMQDMNEAISGFKILGTDTSGTDGYLGVWNSNDEVRDALDKQDVTRGGYDVTDLFFNGNSVRYIANYTEKADYTDMVFISHFENTTFSSPYFNDASRQSGYVLDFTVEEN